MQHRSGSSWDLLACPTLTAQGPVFKVLNLLSHYFFFLSFLAFRAANTSFPISFAEPGVTPVMPVGCHTDATSELVSSES